METICIDGKCLKKCLQIVLNEKNMLKCNEDFIKNYDKNSAKGYILEVDVKDPKRRHNLHRDLPFLPERIKSNKCKKLVCNLYIKKTMLFT